MPGEESRSEVGQQSEGRVREELEGERGIDEVLQPATGFVPPAGAPRTSEHLKAPGGMEQPSTNNPPSERSDAQSAINAEETLGGDHRDQTEEPAGADHMHTVEKIDGDTDPEETLGVHLTDTSPEETPGFDNRDTAQKLTGDHHTDDSAEKTLGVRQGNTSSEETLGVHLTDTSQKDASGTDHNDTTPEGSQGVKDKDTEKEEPSVTHGIREPEVTTPDPEGSEGASGGEQWKDKERDKKEGEKTLTGGASGEEAEATEEVEVGEEEKPADFKSSAQAAEVSADENTSPAEEPPSPVDEPPSPAEKPPSPVEPPIPAEEPLSLVDEISSPIKEDRKQHPEEQAECPETSLKEEPCSPEVAEGGAEAGDTQPDGDAQGSAAGVGATAEGAGPVETDKPPAPEKKKPVEKKRDVARSRTIPKSYGGQSRKAIMEKFGGPAAGPAPGLKVQRSTSFGASSVKNMLLEWCKAKTRDYEHVDIQNFSSSWSSGMAFCALVHKFFPEEFDYATLDPKNRRQNFEIAFSTAEKCADCAQLLEVDDMVRMRVPDSKCVYTYIQEVYRSLVQMGLVKTKKQ